MLSINGGYGESWGTSANISVKDLGYESRYPEGADLRPDRPLHKKIVSKVLDRARDSFDTMQNRHRTWGRIDEQMTVYIPHSHYEKELKHRARRGGNEGEDFHPSTRPVSIVVPHSYATYETIQTYMTSAFLGDSVFPYEGTGPEDEIGAKLLEVLVEQQVNRTKARLAIHTAIGDSLKYGIGVTTPAWTERWGRRPMIQEVPRYSPSGQFLGVDRVKASQEVMLFEGTKLVPIDPYRFLPDPNVSIDHIQDGEFVGWSCNESILNLLKEEETDPSLFNVKYMKDRGGMGGRSRFAPDNSRRMTNAGGSGVEMMGRTASTRYATLVHLFAKIIPKEWGLGSSERVETWLFTVAGDSLLLRARPIDMDHGMFPVAVAAPDSDGYSITPISRMELVYGLQTVLNWLFNSHVANVRKSLNDMFVVDPGLIHMPDLERPGPGKLVRLRKTSWGRGVKGGIAQLQVHDATRGNIGDATFTMDLMQRMSAATDATQGIMRSGGERRSAAEFQGTMNSALSRLEHMARIISEQYMKDLGYFYAANAQQYMSQGAYAKAVGSWPELLQQEYGETGGVYIDPADIVIDYDITVKDGSTPLSGNSQVWTQLFQSVAASPELMQKIDVGRMFMHIARLTGAKDVWEFVRKGPGIMPTVQDDATVQAEVQAGNLVPLAEAA